jgi:hypothetical protein
MHAPERRLFRLQAEPTHSEVLFKAVIGALPGYKVRKGDCLKIVQN